MDFFKAAISLYIEASWTCQGKRKLFMEDLLANGIHEKLIICQ